MKSISVNIPEAITGVSPSCELLICSDFNKIFSLLEPIFPNTKKNEPIRLITNRPNEITSIIELELWKINEELAKLNWQDLTIKTASVMLANYSLLKIEEKLAYQPFLWAYILYSATWCAVLSNVILSFLNENHATTKTLRDICTKEQRLAIVYCLERLHKKFSSDRIPLNFESGLDLTEEIERVSSILEFWRIEHQ